MSQPTWHLIKAATNEEYGPLSHEALLGLAAEAKISSMDKLSNDGRQNWRRAPMVRELNMDWLIQMPDLYLYGPTNVSTIQEFLATGDIDESVIIINCVDGSESRLRDLPFFKVSPQQVRSVTSTNIGTQWPDLNKGSGDAMLQQRVKILEKQVMEYQRTLDEWQRAHAILKQQFIEATGREPL
ncbi:MAG: hypothetical protein NTV80_15975 [Verrucomicrobia bacterium]|nr:hypothetical protein [Verrucomicrobiota bacterium]